MTRTIRAATAAALLGSGLASVGCVHTGTPRGEGHGIIGDCYRNAVDPCYPERYQHAARQAVLAPFAQQVHNGHILNQTLFSYHFETGSDKLNAAGREKLLSIARTRPAPDPRVYIQAVGDADLPLTDENADKIRDLRAELTAQRAESIRKYLATIETFTPVEYEIYVHNPATPGIPADMPARAYRGSFQGYTGGITGSASIGALSTGGGGSLVNIQQTAPGGAAPGGATPGGAGPGGAAPGSAGPGGY